MLTVADLQERSRNHAHESQILLSGVMKSVTVGNAAYTLVMLAGSSVSPLLWLPYWLDTFATIIVSFTQQITGSLLSTFVPDWRETTIVFSEALWEFMMMSTLMPRGAKLPMLSSWYIVAGLHAVFGVIAMQNLRTKLATGRYSPALGGLVESFRAGLRGNMPFAGAGAALVFRSTDLRLSANLIFRRGRAGLSGIRWDAWFLPSMHQPANHLVSGQWRSRTFLT